VLLVLAPLASLSLAGQEHGRTIPLADIDGFTFSPSRTQMASGTMLRPDPGDDAR
jgi:hypothetical protein